jgi:hypothetical protein
MMAGRWAHSSVTPKGTPYVRLGDTWRAAAQFFSPKKSCAAAGVRSKLKKVTPKKRTFWDSRNTVLMEIATASATDYFQLSHLVLSIEKTMEHLLYTLE